VYDKVLHDLDCEMTALILDEQVIKYRALDQWFQMPQGARVARAFLSELQGVCELFSGTRLVQLGLCGDNIWLPALRFSHQFRVSPFAVSQSRANVVAALNALPFDRNSVDCVIAPLILEAFGHDKTPLNEIDRILKPMGYVVFFGVNPWSFWGAALGLKTVACFGDRAGLLTSSLSLKHVLFHHGYTQCMLKSFYYIPPVRHQKAIRYLEFFNEMGKMIWPFPAGFYCLIVQKYQPASPTCLFDGYNNDLISFAHN
jgi:SAM-dependent methyltransferase